MASGAGYAYDLQDRAAPVVTVILRQLTKGNSIVAGERKTIMCFKRGLALLLPAL